MDLADRIRSGWFDEANIYIIYLVHNLRLDRKLKVLQVSEMMTQKSLPSAAPVDMSNIGLGSLNVGLLFILILRLGCVRCTTTCSGDVVGPEVLGLLYKLSFWRHFTLNSILQVLANLNVY